MVDPFDPDEPEAEDPFGARSDRGYRIGARLSGPERPRLGPRRTLALVAVSLAVAIAALGPRQDPTRTVEPAPAPPESTPAVVIGTPLPLLQDLGWRVGRPGPFPVFAGGLRWLDPATGSISGNPFDAPRGWLNVAADGSTICVCLDSPWSETAAVEQLDVRRFDPSGHEEPALDGIMRLESTIRATDSIVRDAVLSEDRTQLFLAYGVRGPDGWTLGVGSTPIVGSEAGRASVTRLGTLLEDPDHRLLVAATVRVSRSSEVMVAIRWRPRDRVAPTPNAGWRERTWRLRPDGDGLAVVGSTAETAIDDPDRCYPEGWASDADYVLLCRTIAADSVVPVARVVGPDGAIADVTVGDPLGPDDVDWLVDSSLGVVYRWSPFSHALSRLDVASREVRSRVVGSNEDEIARATPDRSTTSTGPRAPRWTRFADGQGFDPPARLAGSPDGSRIYAIGLRSVRPDVPAGPEIASTGVWVFDAADLALLAHWPAAAMYDQIASTPGGGALVATATPGSDGKGAPTRWSYSVTFHDVADGHVAEVIGDTVGSDGFTPVLLLPGGP